MKKSKEMGEVMKKDKEMGEIMKQNKEVHPLPQVVQQHQWLTSLSILKRLRSERPLKSRPSRNIKMSLQILI